MFADGRQPKIRVGGAGDIAFQVRLSIGFGEDGLTVPNDHYGGPWIPPVEITKQFIDHLISRLTHAGANERKEGGKGNQQTIHGSRWNHKKARESSFGMARPGLDSASTQSFAFLGFPLGGVLFNLMAQMRNPPVLAIDDSLDDLMLMKMAVEKLSVSVDLITVCGGDAAIAYFEGKDKYADRTKFPLPKLVLLDLKMPRVNGFDVLAAVQKMQLPIQPFIVVLSSSGLPQDREKALALGAVGYQIKPVDFTQLCEVVGRLIPFYCSSSHPLAARDIGT